MYPSLTFSSCTFCPHSVFMFCVDLRNRDYFPMQHYEYLNGSYNRDGVCLLRGTDWVFMCFVWVLENKQRLFPSTALTDMFL
jgi:hypothetical protein